MGPLETGFNLPTGCSYKNLKITNGVLPPVQSSFFIFIVWKAPLASKKLPPIPLRKRLHLTQAGLLGKFISDLIGLR